MASTAAWQDLNPVRLICLQSEAVHYRGEPVRLPSNRCFELLVFLASTSGRPTNRAELAELIWGRRDLTSAKHSLSNALYTLRRQLPNLVIHSSRLSVRLDISSLYYDVHAVRACLRVNDIRGLLNLYNQPFLSTYTTFGTEYFAEWVHEQRQSLHLQVCNAVADYFDLLERTGDWDSCASLARDLQERLDIRQHVGAIAKWLGHDTGSPSSDARISVPHSEPTSTGPLYSRSEELRTLQQSYRRALSAGPTLTLVSGDPGIGKTHLVKHFLRLAAVNGARIVEARATRPDRRRSYSVLMRAFEEGVNHRVKERLSTVLTQLHAASAVRTSTAIDTFNDISGHFLDAFDRLSQESPIALFIDDFQWCDEASRRVCERIMDELRPAPIHVVLAARSAFRDPFAEMRAPRYSARKTEIHLEGLDERESKQLAVDTGLIHGFHLDDHAAALVYKRAGGNPFYIIEVVASLPRHDLREQSINAVLPYSVKAAIVGRISLLPGIDRAALVRLAIAGRPVRQDTLRELLPGSTRPHLSRLRHLGLVTCHNEFVSLSHDLVREALYQRIPVKLRRTLHGKYARVLIRDCADAAEIFWHLKQSGDDKEAAVYARRAAERADDLKAYKDAEYFFRLGVEYAETLEQKTTALERLALFYMRARQPQSAEAVWKSLAQNSDDEKRSRAYLAWKVAALAAADQRAAVDVSILVDEIEQVIRIARENGFRESFVPAVYLLGELALDLERPDLLQRVIEVTHEYSRSLGANELAGELALLEAQLLSYGGQQNEAIDLLTRHEPYCARSTMSRARWLAAKAVVLMNMGRASQSVRCYEDIALLTKDAAPEFWNAQINNYGLVLWECGRYEEAKQLWLKSLAETRCGSAARKVYIHVNLSFLYYDSGDYEAAVYHAQRALDLNASRASRSVLANSWAVIGLCALAQGMMDRADQCFRTVVEIIPDVSCGFSDSTYPEIFIARYIANTDPASALGRLDRAITYRRRSVSSLQTLRLERARLKHRVDPTSAGSEIFEVEEWAIKAGAFAIADQAQLCRRALRSAR